MIVVYQPKQEERAHEHHVELDRHCAPCNQVFAAQVIGLGKGRAGTGADAAFEAEDNAQRDAALLVRLARCPRCGAREGAALRSVLVSLFFMCALGVAAGWAAWVLQGALTARDDETLVLGLVVASIAVFGVGIYRSAQRFIGSKNRVQFLASSKQDNKQGPYRSSV
jgi:hypothetical protein